MERAENREKRENYKEGGIIESNKRRKEGDTTKIHPKANWGTICQLLWGGGTRREKKLESTSKELEKEEIL